jgi:RNA recognition motif-containing protein
MPRTELFLGNLAKDIQSRDITDVFEKYGRILRCDIKNRGLGAVYAFIEFEDERDAEVTKMNN